MKKKFTILLLFILIISAVPSFAVNIGTYQTESEYGLLDGLEDQYSI